MYAQTIFLLLSCILSEQNVDITISATYLTRIGAQNLQQISLISEIQEIFFTYTTFNQSSSDCFDIIFIFYFYIFLGDFQDAISHFMLSHTSPVAVISLFPDFIPNPLMIQYSSHIGHAMHQLAVSSARKGTVVFCTYTYIVYVQYLHEQMTVFRNA